MPRGTPSFSITTMPTVTVTRRLRFNAAHRLHNPALSDQENADLFGKCNNPNWHGHNYVLEVAVEGPIDERTGYVIDLSVLKSIVQHEVIDRVDHRNLNVDVEFMRGVNPTAENIVVACWRVLDAMSLPAGSAVCGCGRPRTTTSNTKVADHGAR
jgi:6-pyruvoyltetrahydropterin/6-carboxytetrahydropterin synthase